MQSIVQLTGKYQKAGDGERICVPDDEAARIVSQGLGRIVATVDFAGDSPEIQTLTARRAEVTQRLADTYGELHALKEARIEAEEQRVDAVIADTEDAWQAKIDELSAQIAKLEETAAADERVLQAMRTRQAKASETASEALAKELRKKQAGLMEQMVEALRKACEINDELAGVYHDACAQLRSATWMSPQSELSRWDCPSLHGDLRRFEGGLQRLQERIGREG